MTDLLLRIVSGCLKESGKLHAITHSIAAIVHPIGHERKRDQPDSRFPPEFTTLITPTSKIKAKVTRKGVTTLARLGSYGRPYG